MAGRWRNVLIPALTLVLLSPGVTFAAVQMSIDGAWIIDSAGRRVSTDRPFQRIISLYGAHTENLCAMGAQTQLVGVGRNDDWPPETRDKPVFSYHDDPEKFLAARPDLVLIRPMIDRGYGQLMHRLKTHGITVVSLQPSDVRQMFVYWNILGRLTGKASAANEMIGRFEETARCIRERTAGLPRKKRVFFESIHDRMRTFAPTAMAIFVLETAGGVNVAQDAVPRRGTAIAGYGKERILSRAKDIDVYLAQIGPMNRPSLQSIQSEPGYGLIRAVQQGEIYFVDEKLVSRPTLRLLEGMNRVGKALYPHLFAEDGDNPRAGQSHCKGRSTPDSEFSSDRGDKD